MTQNICIKNEKGKKKKGYKEYTAIFLSASPAVLQ